jgi:hypothetical protein
MGVVVGKILKNFPDGAENFPDIAGFFRNFLWELKNKFWMVQYLTRENTGWLALQNYVDP